MVSAIANVPNQSSWGCSSQFRHTVVWFRMVNGHNIIAARIDCVLLPSIATIHAASRMATEGKHRSRLPMEMHRARKY